jgi:hypothetical protein
MLKYLNLFRVHDPWSSGPLHLLYIEAEGEMISPRDESINRIRTDRYGSKLYVSESRPINASWRKLLRLPPPEACPKHKSEG